MIMKRWRYDPVGFTLRLYGDELKWRRCRRKERPAERERERERPSLSMFDSKREAVEHTH